MPEGSTKSGGGMSPGTIVFILALFGVGTPLMLSATRQTPSTVVSSEKATTPSDENSAEGLLKQFFDADETQFIDKSQKWQHNPRIYPGPNDSWRSDDPRRDDRISFLIATLPDHIAYLQRLLRALVRLVEGWMLATYLWQCALRPIYFRNTP